MKPEFDARRMVFLVTDPDVEIPEPEGGNDDDLAEAEARHQLELPARYDVCGRCEGKGTHWHEALSNGITQEDRDRDWDDDSWEWLMNGGMDVQCSECKGLRVVPVPVDVVSSPEAQRALALYTAWMDDERDYRAMCEAERRMGC